MAIFISDSAKRTLEFAKSFAATLKGGDVVLLNGEMGAGKTVFAKGVALGLGIEDEVLSPTYSYMNDYNGKLYHFDCYRLSNGGQAEALGLCDYFYSDGICLIEWSQNIASVLPEKVKIVNITKLGKDKRQIDYE
ncbi:MAG: tRNA (adenosine(37)-N6)-threonylcarbamoyltransferase complex ATPase subunit type 1 TsaE [Clostridiales bacterium]|nr:tRNA (adenosine(37)-N6)-threonylcarbamoyltransferase complex ATPase subunit type 1 TsaE [Clostridiales bacterium]